MRREYWMLWGLIIGFFTLPSLTFGQVWPGDINDNGKVTSVDHLYLGVAYGSEGGERPNASTNWINQPLPILWSQNFPGNKNYAFADANGDGQVNDNDIYNAITTNFGETHGTFTGDGFLNGTPNVHPELTLTPSNTVITYGNKIDIAISLGDGLFPINEFYGIAFQLSYNAELVEDQGGITFNLAPGTWIDPTGLQTRVLPPSDQGVSGVTEIAITRINQQNITNGWGDIGVMSILIEDIVGFLPVDTLVVTVDSVKLINNNLQTFPIAASQAMMFVVPPSSQNPMPLCPNVIDPVCGNDGVTYLNSCYAEAAGVYLYTQGVCYSHCIDPAEIGVDANNCTLLYDPVCGCNGVTYINECFAGASGVQNYTPGICPDINCYEPQNILAGNWVELDSTNGVLTPLCSQVQEPVCGCDGITYPNQCWAEASGISFYTQGACGGCIDPMAMNPDTLCPYNYEPVCGCNEVTYPNECVAQAAGVQDYTQGPCTQSSWCDEATPIQCGDFLPYETNIGAGNEITNYPGCLNSTSLVGPDKVYILHKSTPGDLQIGLEIVTPGLDLDIFLLDDFCANVECLESSHTSNSVTNNEGIWYEDAPIGTYYIVVDGQYANSQGSYRLEVSCGYLDCSNATELTCGETMSHNNFGGDDNVSLYKCGNVLNVENNGPEVVHTFTTTEPGQVEISLTNLNENLELFLLSECDAGACMKYSQQGGTTSEYITTFLAPGTYYVVVDGYNGATSTYDLTVECVGACDMNVILLPTNATCGNSDGSIIVNSSGGTPLYLLTWSGPVSGSFSSYNNVCTIDNLPPGTYTVTKTDMNGCSGTGTVTVQDAGNLSVNTSTTQAGCMSGGSLTVDIWNGVAPYNIYLSGPTPASTVSFDGNHTFNGLLPGTYNLVVVDNNGCNYQELITITQNNSALAFTVTPTPAGCGAPGSISVNITSGAAPYWIFLDGPVNFSVYSFSSNLTFNNLPGGTYQVIIEDNNWCSGVQSVVVQTNVLDISATALNGVCGQLNSIAISMNNGTAPFTINWSGPVASSTTTFSSNYVIPNLPNGTYSIDVTDSNGCSDWQLVTVDNSNAILDLSISPMNGHCGDLGFIWMGFNNGNPPYTVAWSGPASGTFTTNNSGAEIPNLVTGCYNITVTDASSCSANEYICIYNQTPLTFNANQIGGGCGQNANISVGITSGEAPFIINWSGPISGSSTSSNTNFTIPNTPSGTYNIIITDANGCYQTQTVSVTNPNNLGVNLTPNSASCGGLGSITVNIMGGSGTYSVSWSGPVFGSINTSSATAVIPNLPAGFYTIGVYDNTGCFTSETVTLISGSGINLSALSMPGACGQNGAIAVSISGGITPFFVTWTGASNGSLTSFGNSLTIPNLPTGSYTITVSDPTGCNATQSVYLNNGGNFNVNALPNGGACGQAGSIFLTMQNGSAPYSVVWSGPTGGSSTAFNNTFNISNLPTGTYTITVTDVNGCSTVEGVFVNNGVNNLTVSATPNNGACGSLGSIYLTFGNGTTPFSIVWTGPSNGTATSFNNNYTIPNLPTGNYEITVSDGNGCTAQEWATITNSGTVSFSSTPNNGSCGNLGSIAVNISNSNSPFNIVWSGPVSGSNSTSSSNYTISNLPTGNYEITVTTANGCSAQQWATITNSSSINFSATPNNGGCGQNGLIALNISGGNTPWTVAWNGASNGSTTTSNPNFVIQNLQTGAYQITVTSASGCSAQEWATLTNSGSVSLSVTPTNGVCGSTGSILVVISGSIPSNTITWTGPVNGSITIPNNLYTIPNLPTGNYEITVSGANGCTAQEWATITNNSSLNAVATAANGACGNLGSINVNIANGNAPYTLTWNGTATGTTSSGNNNITIPNLPSGSYGLTISDAQGCSTTETINLNNGGTTNLSATPSSGVCGQLGFISLTMSGGTTPYDLTWTGPANGSATANNNTYIIPNLPSGNYEVIVTSANGCTAQEWVTISNNTALNATSTGVNGVCGNLGSINVNIANGNAPYTLTWNGAATGTTSSGNNNITIPNLPSGSYGLTISDAQGCSTTETINLNNGGTTNLSATPSSGVCGQLGFISLAMSGGTTPYNVTWAGAAAGSATATNTTFTIPNLPSGNYNITVTSANGCSAAESTILNNSNSFSLAATSIPGACGATGTIALTATGGTAPFNYAWSGAASGSASSGNNSFNINNLPNGSYSITVTDTNGCSNTESATLSNGNTISLAANVSNGGCGQLGSISLNYSGGNAPYTVTWNGPMSGSTTTPLNNFNIPNLLTGTYNITVEDNNGCSAIQSLTVANGGTVSLSAMPINAACGQLASLQIGIATGTAPFAITWNGPVAGSNNTSNNSYLIENLPTGSYAVTVTDATNCSSTISASVMTATPPTVSITGSTMICFGTATGSGSAAASGGLPPYSYFWSNGSFGASISNLIAGSYTVTVSDANNCTNTAALTITENDQITLDVVNTNILCYGDQTGSIHVSGWGGAPPFTYEWSTGLVVTETTPNAGSEIANLAAGDYLITVTDQTSCSTVATISVSQPPPLMVTNMTTINAGCGANNGSATVFIGGGTPPYSYLWSTGQTGQTLSNAAPGLYTVQVTDSYFCQTTFNVTIENDNQAPTANFTYYDELLTVDFSNASQFGASYLWDFGDGETSTDSDPIHEYCEVGTYNVCLTVTNACGTDTYCQSISLTIPSNVVILNVGEVNSSPGGTVGVPVRIDQLDTLVSIAGSVQLLNPSIGTITGVSPGLITPTFSATNQTFSYFEPTGSGIPLSGNDILFYLAVNVTGSAGEESDILLIDTPLTIEVGGMVNGSPTTMEHVTLKGNLSIPNTMSVAGWIHTFKDEGVGNAEVDVWNATFETSYMTGSDGGYQMIDVPYGDEYIIDLEKDTLPSNGLSTFALFIGQQFILGKNPIQIWSPYQVVAGDANCDDKFTTLDLFIIQQVIIGATAKFNSCPSWVFVSEHHPMPEPFDAYNVFPYPNADTMTITQDTFANFIGVKVGDLLGLADPEFFNGGGSDGLLGSGNSNLSSLLFRTQNQSVEAGETFDIIFTADNFDDIVSFQMAMTLDSTKLKYEDITGLELNSIAAGLPKTNELRISWFDLNGVGVTTDSTTELFKLTFTALEDLSDLSKYLTIGSDNFQTEAQNNQFENLDIELMWNEEIVSTTHLNEQSFYLYPNQPNPFHEHTRIRFDLPQAATGELIIQNAVGEIVERIKNRFNEGSNTITISWTDRSAGIYFYTLQVGPHSQTRKMLKMGN